MPNTVNRGGEGWGPDNQAHRRALEDAATRYGGAQAPQLLQVMLNMGRLETNWTGSGELAGGGWFQISDGLRRDMEREWRQPVNRTDINSAADAVARFITEVGTGTGLGATYSTPRSDTINLEVGPGMWHGGIPGYTRFLTGNTVQTGRGGDGIGPRSSRYAVQALQGALDREQLSPQLQGRYEQLYGANAWPERAGNSGMQIGTVGIGSDARFPLAEPAPLIGPDTGIQTDPNWANPTRLNPADVEALSAERGYTLPEGVADFLNMTAPELGGGPGNFDVNSPFPWQTPGRIGEVEGGILQHHALMPNNLRYNENTTAWDVPTEQRFPGGTGIWGSESVAGWLSEVDPATAGAGQDYLRHLGYGAPDSPILPTTSNWPNFQIPNVMTAGVDLSHWIAQQAGRHFGSGMNFGGNIYDASDNFGTRGNVYDASGIPQTRDLYEQYRGNVYDASDIPQTRDLYEQAIGGVANPATYTGPDYSQYFGALGNNINRGASGNWSPFGGYSGAPTYGDFPVDQSPAGSIADAGGGGANMPTDVWGRVQQHTIATPPGGYGSPQPSPAQVLSDQYRAQIDAQTRAATMAQVNASNMQQGMHNTQMLGPVASYGGYGGTNPITTYMNPIPGGPNIINYG